jgi:hypothetical protein
MLLSRDWVETRGIRAGWAIMIGVVALLVAGALVSYITRPQPPRFTFMEARGGVLRADNATGAVVLCIDNRCVPWAPPARD